MPSYSIPTAEDSARFAWTGERGTWVVTSKDSGKRYRIEIGTELVVCTCPSYQTIRRKSTGQICKHVAWLAAHLGWKVMFRLMKQNTK